MLLITGAAKSASTGDDCANGGDGGSGPVGPKDPNELLGPAGYGPQNFVMATALLPYRIGFENWSNAAAPAQFVYVTNQLSTNLDLAGLELTSIGFGDWFFAIPSGSQHYETSVQLSVNSYQFTVQIEAGLDLATRIVYARFQSLNPTNGLPPPVEIGFLPPEDGTGRGDGHLAYIIRSKPNLATGTEIRNIAEIKFDLNEIIRTDQVDPHDASKGLDPKKQAPVTIDASAPSSAVTPLPATATNTAFTVSWSGSDQGAGIAGYDIYVSTNGGPWTLWLANTPLTSAVFQGWPLQTYGFYSVARDSAGNLQTAPNSANTQTTTPTSTLLRFQTTGGVMGIVNGNFRLRLVGMSQTNTVLLEASSNLIQWTPLYTNPPPATLFKYSDPIAPNDKSRFYRGREIP